MGIYSHIPEASRLDSYDYIETFISENVNWEKWNNEYTTEKIVKHFSEKLKSMTQEDFEFLVLHGGYIPDCYSEDSSAETLYSKLIEILVCEWAIRVGFTDSQLQKQKSNKEDITFIKESKVIVCDAKSFRLGRSQAAPNVKDTIKKEAYTAWLSAYGEEERVGGITIFPSLHNWKKGGAAYKYYTEGNPPIMILFYEHMAYILHSGITADNIITFLQSYDTIFPHSDSNQEVYWGNLEKYLFENASDYKDFMAEAALYLKEKTKHALSVIQSRIDSIQEAATSKIRGMSHDELEKFATSILIDRESKELKERALNIKRFRPVNDEQSDSSKEDDIAPSLF